MSRIYFIVFLVSIYLILDVYVFVALRSTIDGLSLVWRRMILIGYWVVSLLSLLGVLLYRQIDPKELGDLRLYITTFFFVLFVGKLFSSVFLVLEDLRRGITYLVNLFPSVDYKFSTSRSDFMQKSALIAGTVPIATLSFGVISGAHDYRVRNRTVYSPNLPKAFDGIRVAQISDIHTGSFFNKVAVEGGIDLLNAQKPDIAFFTGDLVNNRSEEAKEYLDIFKKMNAPLGVFSVMGNHDYGDYSSWSSPQAKKKDVQQLHEMHEYMGYDLLLNENRSIRVDGEEIAILGCENWGDGRFAKYGDLG
ncbi:MAG: metallophosphoesterase, partial [Ekhidna sp.]|nr:metallophosphoesterase [Ekhidna sp.]